MKHTLSIFLLFSLLDFSVFAAGSDKDIDTPNLGFESGNFSNWHIYTGFYYYDLTSTQYTYDWTEQSSAAGRFTIMNQMDTPDPIIACSDMLVVPKDLSLTARIGNPGITESLPTVQTCASRSAAYKATAERMTYEFTVTENSTLLSYRFAAALHVPDNSAHSGNQLPMFKVNIHVIDPATNAESVVPCGSYSATANDANSGLQKNPASCTASSSHKPDEYVYRNWTTGSVNLQKFVGYKVIIEIINHDCLVDISESCSDAHAANCAGGHDSYGYFWAETQKLQLVDKNCGEADPIITAPKGFTKYVWSRSDGKSISTLSSQDSNIAVIPRASMSTGVTYSCTMSSDLCSSGTATTELTPVTPSAKFSAVDSCGGKVSFTNYSTCVGDSINAYTWDFGDSTFAMTDNAVHYYKNADSYNVTLHAVTKLGCEDSVTVPVVIPYFPNLAIEGVSSICSGEKFTLTALDAEVGSKFLWDNGATTQSITDIADTSRYYSLKVTDKRSCEYNAKMYVSVRPTPVVFVTGDSSVCLNDTATLVAHNAVSYVWSNGMDSSEVKVRPMTKTTYKVVGLASNGCKNTTSVTVTVNQLPVLSIDGPAEICEGSAAKLVASGASTYYWADLFSGEEREISPTKTTKYTVRGTDLNGCTSSASKVVTIKALPVITYTGDTLICQGEIAHISVSGASSFVWFDGSVKNYYSQVLNEDTVWTVKGTNNGCTSTVSVPITIKPSPYVYINGIPEVCKNDTLELVATGAATYQWASGETTARLVTVPNVSAKYQVTGTGNNGCTRTAMVDVKVLPLPTVSITGDASVCLNSLAKLYAKGNANVYYWSNGSISDSINPLITAKTKFVVQGVDLYGCKGRDSFMVGTIAPPALSYTGDTVVCSGTPVMFVAKGASSYIWHNGSTAAYYSAVPTMDTTYTVEGWLNGCSSTLSIPVRLLQAPVIWTEGITSICSGDSMKLLAKGAKTYVWSNGTAGEALAAQPLTSSVFHLIGTDVNGCTSAIDVPVTVRLKPQISITGDAEVCVGAAATLTAGGSSVLYTWDNGNTGQTVYPIVLKTTTYTVTGTDKYNCTNTATFEVTPVLPPSISFLGDTATCVGGSLSLVAQGATSYVWQDSVKGSEYTFTPNTNTYVKLSGTAHNCTASRTIQIRVLTPPNILISGDTAVCPGDDFHLVAQGAKSFSWNTGDSTAAISYAPLVPTTYYATGTDGYGCSTTKSYTMKVRTLPVVKIRQIHFSGCPGSKDTLVLGAEGASYYEWTSDPSLPEVVRNFNSNKLTALVNDTTTFHLYGRDLFGCSNVAEMTVSPLPRISIDFAVDPQWIEQSNPTITFRGSSPVEADWWWTPMKDADEVGGRIFRYKYDIDQVSDSVKVSVRAIDRNGCTYEGSKYIYVWKDFWAPTGFTPNSDEKNETFHFYGGQYIDDFSFIIFNRLGEVVFEGKSFDAEWDGTYKGKPCPWGVYGWVAKYKSSIKGMNKSGERKGFISIVR